jgi:beta-glucosidase
MGGQAVAEVLSGKVNPSGKLPVTMPRSVGQVPTVYNHKHSQYSRLFATNETGPLWPFGFGLSYSHFVYSKPSMFSGQPSGPGRVHPRSAAAEYGLSPEAAPEHNEASKAGLATVSITITNEGPYDGAEVVQLYIRDEYASVTRPVKELKAFKRIFLKNGESATVTFDITPEMLQCFGAENRWSVEPGEFTIMVGSSSADEDLQAISYVVEG